MKERTNDNMDFETEKIFFNQIVTQKRESFTAEDNIIIPDIKPDILGTINSSGNVYIYRKEIVNGKLKIDGGIQIDIIYLADNEQNSVRALHTVLDFSKSIDIDNIDESNNLLCKIKIKSIEPKILNGRKINIKVYLDVDISISSNKQKDYVKAIKDTEKIQMISNSMKIDSLKGCGETVATAKDTISIDDNLSDILNTDIFIKNKEIKISYNKVLSKADISIEILYLTEDEQIKSVTAQIPIMGFIDIQGVSDNEICDTDYEIRNIDIRPNNVEEHSISVEIEFLISCNAYEEKELNLIQDLYSPEEDITMNQEMINLMQNKKHFSDSCDVKEKINIPEIKDGKIYKLNVVPNIIKQNVLNNSINYECELDVNMLYMSNVTNRLEEKQQKIDFTHTISMENINKNASINTLIEVETKDYVCNPDNSLNLNINMNFIVDSYIKNPINIVSNIKIEKMSEDTRGNSLVIYFVKDGDTLWKIAKKFRSTIDEIAQINNIDDLDKITVGEQLFIPRYVNSQIS